MAYSYVICPHYTQEHYPVRLHFGDDANLHFLSQLRQDLKMLNAKIQQNRPCIMTDSQKIAHTG